VTDALLDQIVARLLDFEGSCTWMYRDTNPAGIVTCGAGHALFSAEAAILLPWRMGTEHALAGQVRSDYLAVQLAAAVRAGQEPKGAHGPGDPLHI
jgi:hypothetical protein